MMNLIRHLRIVVSVIFIACTLNKQVFAQVQTGLMKCNDIERNIKYTVHFKGNEMLLLLKGFTYRVPYASSRVSKSGERWSAYENSEIRVSTTVPYDKYVAIYTVPSPDLIAHSDCE